MSTVPVTAIAFLTLLVVAAMQHAMPQLTREDIYFGVTVHPEFRRQSAGRRALRLYRIQIWIHAAIVLAP